MVIWILYESEREYQQMINASIVIIVYSIISILLAYRVDSSNGIRFVYRDVNKGAKHGRQEFQ